MLDPPAPVYSGDFTGVAMSELERKLSTSSPLVVGFFNGAEGDIVVKRGVRDVREVVAVGTAFADRVKPLFEPERRTHRLTPTITTRGAELKTELEEDRECGKRSFAKKPRMGAPALGGAEDDRTVFHGLGYRKDRLGIARKGQGGKLGAFDSDLIPGLRLTDIVAPPRKFPEVLPIRYVRIGSFVLATVPAEFSTMAGRRVAERLRDKNDPNDHVVVVGLANEYTGYVATADEYAAQDYMAASTLWGPGEADVFACRLERLKLASLDAPPAPGKPVVVEAKQYYPGHSPRTYDRKMRFGPRGVGERRSAADEELGEILLDPHGVPARGLPIVFWTETVAAGEVAQFNAAARRRVIILRAGRKTERSLSPGPDELPDPVIIDDDRGFGFVTLLREAPKRKKTERMMAAIWLGPILDGFHEGLYQFRIEFRDANNNPVVCDTARSGRAGRARPGRTSRRRPSVDRSRPRPGSVSAGHFDEVPRTAGARHRGKAWVPGTADRPHGRLEGAASPFRPLFTRPRTG